MIGGSDLEEFSNNDAVIRMFYANGADTKELNADT